MWCTECRCCNSWVKQFWIFRLQKYIYPAHFSLFRTSHVCPRRFFATLPFGKSLRGFRASLHGSNVRIRGSRVSLNGSKVILWVSTAQGWVYKAPGWASTLRWAFAAERRAFTIPGQASAVLRIRTDLDQIRIRPLRTDRIRIRIHLSKMYLVVPKV